MTLTPQVVLSGARCEKRSYLLAQPPHLLRPAKGAPLQVRFRQQAVQAASALWPGGAVVPEDVSWEEAARETQRLTREESCRAIFHGAFEHEGLRVRVDVLERSRRMKWYLSNIRSSAAVDERHVAEAGLQTWVLRGLGLDPQEVAVWTVDRNYERNGELNARALFVRHEVSRRVEPWVARAPGLLERARAIAGQPAAPERETGEHCLRPFECEFLDLCGVPLPDDHIAHLPGMAPEKRRALREAGIVKISEIPDSYPLNPRQQRARESVRVKGLVVSEDLKRELDELRYPLWFVDFESLSPVVPRFSGTKPGQHLPFQWSAHRSAGPGQALEHRQFLAPLDEDPRRGFIESLLAHLEEERPVLVWHRGFEDARLAELQVRFPLLAERIGGLRARLVDLLEIVRRHVYHPGFLGSFSIKSVLPALAPELSYDSLEISRGDEASAAYDRLCMDALSDDERQTIEQSLKDYCRLDTLAMVRILEVLKERTGRGADQ